MKQGIDLDVLVAKVVLNLEVKTPTEIKSKERPHLSSADGIAWINIPTYSTFARHALEIIELMNKEGWRHEVGMTEDEGESKYTIAFTKEQEVHSSMSKSFAHAVCLAALKVRGVEFYDDRTRIKE